MGGLPIEMKTTPSRPIRSADIARALAHRGVNPSREFVPGHATYGDLDRLASGITGQCAALPRPSAPLCLATADKSLLMSAVLSSLGGGPPLVLPNSLTEAVVSETCAAVGAASILADPSVTVPGGVRRLFPDGGAKARRWTARGAGVPFLWLYTGGSTGAPKLWPKTARNLLGEALFLRSAFRVRAADVVLAVVPPLHIYGLLFSVLLPFVSGARTVGDIPYFPREVIGALRRTRCTLFVGSPMHYRALSASTFAAPALRHAFSSGGFLEEDHGRHFTAATGRGVTEIYGSTETGGIATRCRAEGEWAWRPFSCARWRVARGRLRVRSPFLSPGLPADTAGFFVTGDRAEETREGTFVLHGRVDGIVKIAGKRVDVAAIEQKIRTSPLIDDAYVFPLPSRAGRGSEIAALLVTRAAATRVRRALASLLDPIHVPRRIARVRAIPVTPAGKRDRRAALALLSRSARP